MGLSCRIILGLGVVWKDSFNIQFEGHFLCS